MSSGHDKVSNIQQLGGIETSVLDNGAGRGVRIAWVNTGTPFRYKVVIDRALDIADAFYGGDSLAWLSHAGVTRPNPAAYEGLEWLRSFGGGLMATCGLSHIGAPEADASERRGLHGRVGNLPCELTAIDQPDPANGNFRMALHGVVRESSVLGPQFELYRTISSELGKSEIHVSDRVVNRGNKPAPHMLLYHCNFGWPLVDEGSTLYWEGEMRSRGGELDDAVFASDHDCKTCPPPLDSHNGRGEACAFISPGAVADGWVLAGLRNEDRGIELEIRFRPEQLPCLTNWQHWGRGEYVTALEPGTHFPVGQAATGKAGDLILLDPGEERDYELRFTVSSTG